MRTTRAHSFGHIVLAAAVFGLFASPAAAQTEYGQGIMGYVGLAGFYAMDSSTGKDDTRIDQNSYGATLRGGFRLGVPLAIELQGDWNYGLRSLEAWTITTNFRAYLVQDILLDRRLQPYAVAGVGVMAGNPTGEKDYELQGAFRMGLGTNFYLTEDLALDFFGEWVTGTGSFSDVNYGKLALGFQYNFGSN